MDRKNRSISDRNVLSIFGKGLPPPLRGLRVPTRPPAAYTAAQPASVQQLVPESAILRRAAAKVRNVEPAWHFVSAICNCPPLMDEQLGVAAGTWEQTGDGASVRKRYEVNFRKGRFLAFVSGESQIHVERFAKHLLSAISDDK
jgi:hypothetical protein